MLIEWPMVVMKNPFKGLILGFRYVGLSTLPSLKIQTIDDAEGLLLSRGFS